MENNVAFVVVVVSTQPDDLALVPAVTCFVVSPTTKKSAHVRATTSTDIACHGDAKIVVEVSRVGATTSRTGRSQDVLPDRGVVPDESSNTTSARTRIGRSYWRLIALGTAPKGAHRHKQHCSRRTTSLSINTARHVRKDRRSQLSPHSHLPRTTPSPEGDVDLSRTIPTLHSLAAAVVSRICSTRPVLPTGGASTIGQAVSARERH